MTSFDAETQRRRGKTTANAGMALRFLCAFASLRQKKGSQTDSEIIKRQLPKRRTCHSRQRTDQEWVKLPM
jgi:hypothetical protein